MYVRRMGLRRSCLGQDEEQDEVRQVEERVVEDCTPEAACFMVEPALGKTEKEKRDEGGVGEGLEEVVRGGEKGGGSDCQRDGGETPPPRCQDE